LAEQLDPAVVCSYTREVHQGIRIPNSGTVGRGEVSADRHQGMRIPDSGIVGHGEVSADRHQGIRIPDSGSVSHSEVSADRPIIEVDHVEPAADWQIDERESRTWNRTQESYAAFPVSIYVCIHILCKCT
jgi:hypothetical protein